MFGGLIVGVLMVLGVPEGAAADAERLRSTYDVARDAAGKDAAFQPVFNLEVASGQSFLVGEVGALVHDNSLVRPVATPFDAVKILDAR